MADETGYLLSNRSMHAGLGRKHPLHVDLIHLSACPSYIQDIMTEAILSHPRLSLQRKTALVKALGKVLWVQNDLMAKWHTTDGAEYGNMADDVEIEAEGYLHGKKVLDDLPLGSGSEDGAKEVSPPACPFSSQRSEGIHNDGS